MSRQEGAFLLGDNVRSGSQPVRWSAIVQFSNMKSRLASFALHLAAGLGSFAAESSVPEAGLIRIKGPIGPATADYIARATRVAAERKYECLIIQLDTPGGLLDSTKEI